MSQDMQRFKFTIPQRKEKEEGSTHLTTSMQWAYYDDPEDIDRLIVWLDERGHREKQLRKELQIFRDRIAEYMEKMKKHLAKVDKPKKRTRTRTASPAFRRVVRSTLRRKRPRSAACCGQTASCSMITATSTPPSTNHPRKARRGSLKP